MIPSPVLVILRIVLLAAIASVDCAFAAQHPTVYGSYASSAPADLPSYPVRIDRIERKADDSLVLRVHYRPWCNGFENIDTERIIMANAVPHWLHVGAVIMVTVVPINRNPSNFRLVASPITPAQEVKFKGITGVGNCD